MSLLLKVTRTNLINGIMNEYAPKVIAALSTFTGKAYLATGMKSKKFAELLENLNLPHSGQSVVRISNSYGSMILTVSVNFDGGFYETVKTDFYFGRVNDGILTLRKDGFVPFKTDYSADAIQSAKNKVEALKGEISQIEKEFSLYIFQ